MFPASLLVPEWDSRRPRDRHREIHLARYWSPCPSPPIECGCRWSWPVACCPRGAHKLVPWLMYYLLIKEQVYVFICPHSWRTRRPGQYPTSLNGGTVLAHGDNKCIEDWGHGYTGDEGGGGQEGVACYLSKPRVHPLSTLAVLTPFWRRLMDSLGWTT